MKKTILLSTGLLILAGCATPPAPPVKVDREPLLVGIPLGERLAKTSRAINEQSQLLKKVQTKTPMGEIEVVKHNNDVDARKGSPRTLPQSYAESSVAASSRPTVGGVKDLPARDVIESPKSTNEKMQRIIKRIEWSDSSANNLAASFAKGLGYNFIKDTSNKDVNISLLIENETMESAIAKFKNAVKDHANLVVSDQAKSVYLVYKK